MYRLLGIILLCLAGIPARAQSLRPGAGMAEKPSGDAKAQSAAPRLRVSRAGKSDTLYSIGAYRRHGWYEPSVVVSEDVAARRAVYRFTHRDDNGHWRRIETIDRGAYAGGKLTPYIVDLKFEQRDSLVDIFWRRKLANTCRAELSATADGQDFMQERVYDADGNLIYTFSRTPLPAETGAPRRFVGSYRDAYGLPAEMRVDTAGTYTYGTLVSITEDRYGTDSIIEYMDACGVKKLNSAGVAAERNLWDSRGQLHQQMAWDMDGNRTANPAGLCGAIASYDERGLQAEVTYLDAAWRPIRMPAPGYDPRCVGAVTARMEYDDDYRPIRFSFYDEFGHPMANADGAHRIEYTYDESGAFGQMVCYDMAGRAKVSSEDIYADRPGQILRLWSRSSHLIGKFVREQLNRPFHDNSCPYFVGEPLCNPLGLPVATVNVDEFGEPAYDCLPRYYYCGIHNYDMFSKVVAGKRNFDEDSREITDLDELRTRLPKVWGIAEVDSAAYAQGLRDGDIILSDGDYRSPLCGGIDCDKMTDARHIHNVLTGDSVRRMVVFRVNPETRAHGLVGIDYRRESAPRLGYENRLRYLTRRQVARIDSCISADRAAVRPLIDTAVLATDTLAAGSHALLLCDTFDENGENRANAIVLGVVFEDEGLHYLSGEDVQCEAVRKLLDRRDMQKVSVLLTTDGRKIEIRRARKDDFLDCRAVYVDDGTYSSVMPLTPTAAAMLDSLLYVYGTEARSFKAADVVGYWSTEGTNPQMWFEIDRHGRLQGGYELTAAETLPGDTVCYRSFTARLAGNFNKYGYMEIRVASGTPLRCRIAEVRDKIMTVNIDGDKRVYLHKTGKPRVRPAQAAEAVKPSADAKVK